VGSGHLGVRRLERVIFHGSFKPGDTLLARGSVVKVDPGTDPGKGAVTLNIRLSNQADQLLLEFEPVFTMPKRGG
jgi:acyl dehydratase